MEAEDLFAVDRWGCKKSKVFFLTHMHTDHTKGLSQHWRRGPIYCSAITAALLRLRFPALEIHILPLSTPTLISLPSPHLLEVTAIDADHCPGSVMFVFRGIFGCILHTGDFRWESGSPRLDMMKHCLASAIGGSSVNLVHLDNTFCSPRFSFPTRHRAAQQVVDIIRKHEGSDVILGIDMLGKEELLIFIAKALETKIWVWPERLQIMRILGVADFFTSDSTATRIRAVPRYSVSNETLNMLSEMRPTVAILPSGLNYSKAVASSGDCCSDATVKWVTGASSHQTPKTTDWAAAEEGKNLRQTAGKRLYFVPYSLHSCFSELKEFLEYIKPLSVKGNVRSSKVDVNALLLQIHGKRERDSRCSTGSTGLAGTASATRPDGDDLVQGCHSVMDDACLLTRSNMNCAQEKEPYLCRVKCDLPHLEDDAYPAKKLRARWKKASCKQSQQSWAALRKRRGGGTLLCAAEP